MRITISKGNSEARTTTPSDGSDKSDDGVCVVLDGALEGLLQLMISGYWGVYPFETLP